MRGSMTTEPVIDSVNEEQSVMFQGIIEPGQTVEHKFIAVDEHLELRITFYWPQHEYYNANPRDKVNMSASYLNSDWVGQYSSSNEVWQDIILPPCTWSAGTTEPGVHRAMLHHTRTPQAGPQPYRIIVDLGVRAKLPAPGRPPDAQMPNFCAIAGR